MTNPTNRRVKFDRYGDVDVLHIDEGPGPSHGTGEVVVRVLATGIGPGEAAIREGKLDSVLPATFPSGQGSELAGVVHAVGGGRWPRVTRYSVGRTTARRRPTTSSPRPIT